jgi:hypothetical protein
MPELRPTGAWWLDGVVALGIAGWAVIEGRRAWAGRFVRLRIAAWSAVLIPRKHSSAPHLSSVIVDER